MEVGGSSDDSSGNKRKLGAATTAATGATSATTGPIANGNSSQHATSDQGTSQGPNSLANPDSTTSTASPKAQSSETPPKARFKIGTREGSAQEGSASKQISDSQAAGVNGWTTPLNHEEAEMARGKHSSRSISVSSRSQNQFLTTLLSF